MDNTEGCSVVIGTVTQAMSVQKILADAAIPTAVIKYESSSKGSRGCVYALSFSCSQSNNVRTVLSHKGIKVKQWNVRS